MLKLTGRPNAYQYKQDLDVRVSSITMGPRRYCDRDGPAPAASACVARCSRCWSSAARSAGSSRSTRCSGRRATSRRSTGASSKRATSATAATGGATACTSATERRESSGASRAVRVRERTQNQNGPPQGHPYRLMCRSSAHAPTHTQLCIGTYIVQYIVCPYVIYMHTNIHAYQHMGPYAYTNPYT